MAYDGGFDHEKLDAGELRQILRGVVLLIPGEVNLEGTEAQAGGQEQRQRKRRRGADPTRSAGHATPSQQGRCQCR